LEANVAYLNSLAVFISYALNTLPDSDERRHALTALEIILDKNPDDLVLGLVCDALAGRRAYGDVTFAGKHAAAFSSFFNNSPIVTNLREELCAWAVSCTDGLPGLHLADLGCGDGRAIAKVIECCVSHSPRPVHLFLNDRQPQMLSAAEEHIRTLCSDLDTTVTIYPCIGRAEEPGVAEAMQAFFADEMDSVLITAIFSIHHAPYDTKLTLLRQIAELRPRLFVIGDANTEHDIHYLPRSPEIVANAMRAYNSYYRSLTECGATPEMLEAGRYFLGSEARNVILNEIDERIEYHTTVEHWKELLENAGFGLADTKSAAAHLSVSPNRRICEDHFDSFVYENEALCFSLGAKAAV
jgi:hypothetical protein